MSESQLTTHTVDTPGARLYYEQRGTGPLLLLIGSPMDSTGFTGLAGALADRYTVVTYDPRGIGNSSREDTDQDVTPELQADDVHRLVSALGGGPADVFGSSGGAVVGLALVTAHPDQVRTLVAHEPPVIELLPDRGAAARRDPGHLRHLPGRWGGRGDAEVHGPHRPRQRTRPSRPTRRGGNRRRSRSPGCAPPPDMFLAHLIRPTTDYRPDVEALRAAPARIVVGAGATSAGQLANRTAVALADRARHARGRVPRRPRRVRRPPAAVQSGPGPGTEVTVRSASAPADAEQGAQQPGQHRAGQQVLGQRRTARPVSRRPGAREHRPWLDGHRLRRSAT